MRRSRFAILHYSIFVSLEYPGGSHVPVSSIAGENVIQVVDIHEVREDIPSFQAEATRSEFGLSARGSGSEVAQRWFI